MQMQSRSYVPDIHVYMYSTYCYLGAVHDVLVDGTEKCNEGDCVALQIVQVLCASHPTIVS